VSFSRRLAAQLKRALSKHFGVGPCAVPPIRRKKGEWMGLRGHSAGRVAQELFVRCAAVQEAQAGNSEGSSGFLYRKWPLFFNAGELENPS
jgi:hypothetical protein